MGADSPRKTRVEEDKERATKAQVEQERQEWEATASELGLSPEQFEATRNAMILRYGEGIQFTVEDVIKFAQVRR